MQVLNNGIFSVKSVRDIEGNAFAMRINILTGDMVRYPTIKKALDSTADNSEYFCVLPTKDKNAHASKYLENSVAPIGECVGVNVKTVKPHTLLDKAGQYMPVFNLHLGFETVVKAARDSVQREIVKAERKPLFTAYVKACNKYQLICLPDQTAKPFNICGGSVFHACDGSIERFMGLVTATLKRDLTKKESVFIRSQYQPITANDRAKVSGTTRIMSNGGIGDTLGDTSSRFRTIGELYKAGSAVTKDYIYQNFQSTKTIRFDHKLVFNYNDEVKKIRAMLKRGTISHSEYKTRYADLKAKRDKVLEVLETSAGAAIRNMHKNGSTVRVMHNAKGSTATGSNGSRYTVDGYRVDDKEVKPQRKRDISDERDNQTKGNLPDFWLARLADPEQKRSEILGYMEWLAKHES